MRGWGGGGGGLARLFFVVYQVEMGALYFLSLFKWSFQNLKRKKYASDQEINCRKMH